MKNAISDTVVDHIYSIWENESNELLGITDYMSMSYELAIRKPEKSKEMLYSQRKRIKDPDRLRQFDFISRAAISDTIALDTLFNSLITYPEARRIEPWSRQVLSLLNHPIREKFSVKYIRPALDALEEVQRTGDIFFPGNWCSSLLSNHRSNEAYNEVKKFIKDNPSSINLFASSFENKDVIADSITAYNETVDEIKEIRYTDLVGIMMSSVTTIINAITYVLIAFVAVSLIVSSIMIGVITLISVQERTKEIGILRAIGASKRNVSSMFNAETVIIGFTSGMLGVIVTYILCIPINAILHSVTGIENLSTHLPIYVAAILVLISMLLTLIAGIIPSRSAAKKDPVVALRTE